MIKGGKIVFIGDSITDVAFNRRTRHLKARKSYPLTVAKTLGKGNKYYFKGVASNRAYHVYDRLTRDCIAFEPDAVVLLVGVNDAWERYVPEQYPPLTREMEPHYRELLRRLRAELKPSAQMIPMLPFMINSLPEKFPFRPVLNEYRDIQIRLLDEFGYDYIDLQKIFDDAEKIHKPSELSTDGIHPTALGHSFIASAVLKKLL